MPQTTKPDTPSDALGVAHENLEGWIPPLAADAEVRDALEKAFDYRGDVTITTKSGETVEGYVFDRRCDGPALADCRVRLYPKTSDEKRTLAFADVARLEFTGRDAAAGKSFETWIKKYTEKKLAGETDIGIASEKLEE